jgi:hypothetical protein
MKKVDTEFEEGQRSKTTCVGCGSHKDIGLIICWSCFKYRDDIPVFKYYQGSLREWLADISPEKPA